MKIRRMRTRRMVMMMRMGTMARMMMRRRRVTIWTFVPRADDIQGEKRAGGRRSRNRFG